MGVGAEIADIRGFSNDSYQDVFSFNPCSSGLRGVLCFCYFMVGLKMNIIDAIKSGKPFKRPGYAWTCPLDQATHQWLSLPKDDLIADDWEIQEPREFCISLNRNNGLPVSCELIVCGQFCGGGHDVEIVHVREILE